MKAASQENVAAFPSERLYRCWVEALPHPAWVLGANLTFEYVNPRFTAVTGRSLVDLGNVNALLLVASEDRDRVAREAKERLERQETLEFEHRLRWHDGSLRWVLSTLTLLEGSSPRRRWLGVTVDIDERKRAEEKVCASEHMYRELVERLPRGAAFVVDHELRYLMASGQAFHEAGFVSSDFKGRTLRDVLPPELWAQYEPFYRQALAGRAFEYEHEIQGRHFVTRGAPWRNADGTIHAALAVSYDITDRKQAEAALHQSEELFRTFVELNPQIPWRAHRDGHLLDVSDRWLELTGRSREQTLREGWVAASHSEDQPAVEEAWAQAVHRGQPCDVEHRVQRANGTYRWMRSRAFAHRDAEGQVVCWYGTTEDVHDRKHAEEVLQDADRRKDEFLATLAHELRNPLAPIRMGLEVMQAAPENVAAVAKARAMMARQLAHLVRLVDDLLDVSRISRGKVELKRVRVALRSAVEHALETSRPLVVTGQHQLVVRWPDEPVWVNGDLTRLAQVVSNLVNNAAKYTPPGGHIALTVTTEAQQGVVRVSDNGTGIAAEMLPKVFDLFAQVEKTLDRAQGGLGIGLSLAKTLVEMHGGSLTAESPGLGHGSTFTMRLPVESAASDGASLASITPLPSELPFRGGRRVLVVDDNVDGAESLALMLDQWGCTTSTAHTGSEALSAARAFRPDLVFLDLGLPGMNGYEVARAFRRDPELAETVLVALTGWGSDYDKRRSRDAGFNFHLTKPAEAAAIETLLGDATARRG